MISRQCRCLPVSIKGRTFFFSVFEKKTRDDARVNSATADRIIASLVQGRSILVLRDTNIKVVRTHSAVASNNATCTTLTSNGRRMRRPNSINRLIATRIRLFARRKWAAISKALIMTGINCKMAIKCFFITYPTHIPHPPIGDGAASGVGK